MALQSQAPRAGTARRYTTTNRRKKSLTPWLALLGVAVILGGLYVLFGLSDDPAAQANTPNPNEESPSQAQAASAAGQDLAPSENSGVHPGNATDTQTTPGSARNTPDTPGQRHPDPNRFTISNLDRPQLAGEAKDQYELGMQRLESGDIATGRALLSELLFRDGALPRHEAQAVRERLQNVNERIVFSAKNRSNEKIAADPILTLHKVQSGEYLSTVGNTYRTPYQLIERINGIDARRLQAGQAIQVIKGPVHARVDKSDYRMDLYVVDPDGLPIYLKSYSVGLGEFDSTPIGTWRIKPGSKVGPANGGPSWVNPRTGERYDRNDPDIPIGEYWMALEGTDENTREHKGYGIHATNDPESIGRQESMGCIRMRDEDVDQVFYTLFEGASVVEIVP